MGITGISPISGLQPLSNGPSDTLKARAAVKPEAKTTASAGSVSSETAAATNAAGSVSATSASSTGVAATGDAATHRSAGSAAVSGAPSSTLNEVTAADYSTTAGGKSYAATVEESDGEYTASVPGLAGATATGSSIVSAEMNLTTRVDELV